MAYIILLMTSVPCFIAAHPTKAVKKIASKSTRMLTIQDLREQCERSGQNFSLKCKKKKALTLSTDCAKISTQVSMLAISLTAPISLNWGIYASF